MEPDGGRGMYIPDGGLGRKVSIRNITEAESPPRKRLRETDMEAASRPDFHIWSIPMSISISEQGCGADTTSIPDILARSAVSQRRAENAGSSSQTT